MSALSTPLEGTPGVQNVPILAPVSPEAAALAAAVMRGEMRVSHAMERVAEHFGGQPKVDTVIAALTTFAPDDTDGWVHLGGRAWLREWLRPGSPCRTAPVADAGPEAALTMPWMSQLVRHDIAVIPDTEQLPPEAAQDRRELASCGVHAVLGSAQTADGTMYGSISLTRGEPGLWPETYVADLRLLSAALTSRMAAEQARRSLADAIALADQARASQQQFFAAIGHELRTPISAIVGFAEVLADEAVELDPFAGRPEDAASGEAPPSRAGRFPRRVAQDAAIILRAGEQLLAVVEDLLRTGRVLGDEQPREAVSVFDAMQDVVHWLRTPASTARVSVGSDIPPDLRVWATPSSLRQILTNLVSNGVVHNIAGGTVAVSSTRSSGESGEARIRITVRDSGPGLTPEQQAGVFEPFVRFAKPGVRGTGLGLPLSRAIAERHGGTLGVESTPGQGSAFWVELPAGQAEPPTG